METPRIFRSLSKAIEFAQRIGKPIPIETDMAPGARYLRTDGNNKVVFISDRPPPGMTEEECRSYDLNHQAHPPTQNEGQF